MKKQKSSYRFFYRSGIALTFILLLQLSPAKAQKIYSMDSNEFTSLTNVVIFGNAGDDILIGGSEQVWLSGNAGEDQLYGSSKYDALFGGIGNDYLSGGDDTDVLVGGSGDDILKGDNGNDNLYGDVADYFITFPTPDWTQTYISDPSDPDFGNVMIEKNGISYGPNDLLYSYETMSAKNDENASPTYVGNDKLYGGPGNDTLNGNGGEDTAGYKNAAGGVTASLADGKASNDGDGGTDTFIEIENLEGSQYNDHLFGDDKANILYGLAGSDYLDGGKGLDTLIGGAGNDYFAFGPGDGSSIIADYTVGDIIDCQQFGATNQVSEAVINGSKIITIEGDVRVTLENYTGPVEYLFQQLDAGSGN
ncbi:MAG: hypothetical protein KTR30_06020 [Saprospiraceae bacterium]|nr:hypothetical protein [Saprospiraceae bacterium]